MKITGSFVIGFYVVCSMVACLDIPVAVADSEPAVVVVKELNGSFSYTTVYSEVRYSCTFVNNQESNRIKREQQ